MKSEDWFLEADNWIQDEKSLLLKISKLTFPCYRKCDTYFYKIIMYNTYVKILNKESIKVCTNADAFLISRILNLQECSEIDYENARYYTYDLITNLI